MVDCEEIKQAAVATSNKQPANLLEVKLIEYRGSLGRPHRILAVFQFLFAVRELWKQTQSLSLHNVGEKYSKARLITSSLSLALVDKSDCHC